MISIVSPVYNAEKILPVFVKQIDAVMKSIKEPFEIVLIDDRSSDNSWEALTQLVPQYPELRAFRLSRNFGQHPAISAGIRKAKGDKIVVMDCDLQDDPIYIPKLLEQTSRNFDIVYTYKKNRNHGWFKNFLASIWHTVFNWLSESPTIMSDGKIGSFSLITRKVANAYINMPESQRHYLMLLRWLGFSSTVVEIEHRERYEGKSSYTFGKLIRHALSGILSQSNRILYASLGVGFLFILGACLATILLIGLYFVHGFMAGWASLMVVILVCTGMILVTIGVTGAYIGMIFEQVKQRPLVVYDEELTAKKGQS